MTPVMGARRRPAARGLLARLVGVVAVLAVLGLTVGMHCPSADHGAGSAGCHATAQADHAMPCQVDAEPVAGGIPDPSGLGAALAACLVVLAAVLAFAVDLAPLGRLISARARPPGRPRNPSAVHPSEPDLALLCVLRI
ncbi:hypothetical protein [Actinokineospora sp. NPDC004072]